MRQQKNQSVPDKRAVSPAPERSDHSKERIPLRSVLRALSLCPPSRGIPLKSSSQLNRFLSAGPLSPGQQPPTRTGTRLERAEEAPRLSLARPLRSAVSPQLAEDDEEDRRRPLTLLLSRCFPATSTPPLQSRADGTLRSDHETHFSRAPCLVRKASRRPPFARGFTAHHRPPLYVKL